MVAPSFAEIFRDNAYQNGLLPVTLPSADCAALADALAQIVQRPELAADAHLQIVGRQHEHAGPLDRVGRGQFRREERNVAAFANAQTSLSSRLSLTAGLRMELRGTGVDVLLVSPSSTATDFFDSAATVDVSAVRMADSQYTPQRVARAVVTSSRRRRREVTLSVEGKAITMIRRLSHRLADAIMYRVAKSAMPTANRHEGAEAERHEGAA